MPRSAGGIQPKKARSVLLVGGGKENAVGLHLLTRESLGGLKTFVTILYSYSNLKKIIF